MLPDPEELEPCRSGWLVDARTAEEHSHCQHRKKAEGRAREE